MSRTRSKPFQGGVSAEASSRAIDASTRSIIGVTNVTNVTNIDDVCAGDYRLGAGGCVGERLEGHPPVSDVYPDLGPCMECSRTQSGSQGDGSLGRVHGSTNGGSGEGRHNGDDSSCQGRTSSRTLGSNSSQFYRAWENLMVVFNALKQMLMPREDHELTRLAARIDARCEQIERHSPVLEHRGLSYAIDQLLDGIRP